jgi:hypothetical protein
MTFAVPAARLPVAPALPPALLRPPSATPTPRPPVSVPVLILGLDEAGRPHASRFAADDAESARDAAAVMGMVPLAVEDEPVRRLAAQLPPGRLFASGKAFVPFVRQALYDQLVGCLPDGVAPPSRPVKLAQESTSAPTGDAKSSSGGEGDRKPAAGDGEATSGAAAKLSAPTAAAPRASLPEGWDKLRVGNLVLASVERDDGWWPAIVTEDKGDGLFVLKWEDWSDWEPFLRKREDLALLHPAYAAK